MAQPETPDAIDSVAAILELEIPETCRDGVAANLILLQGHFAVVAAVLTEKDIAE